jgi:hypothetical protein
MRDSLEPRGATDAERQTRRLQLAWLAALFALGFAVRWCFSDGDFIGDDAWYFYLARGFGGEPGVQAEHPWFHLANRPLFYLLLHPSTYFGLWGFRFAGCLIGAALPCAAYAAARALGASKSAAMLSAVGLCLHRSLIIYSAYVFPDVLAALFALGACVAAARGRRGWLLVLAWASVLCKESFVLVPLVAAYACAPRKAAKARPDFIAVMTCGVPLAYVGAISLLSLRTPGLRMQGWSLTPFGITHARAMLIGPELWPLLAWLAYRRQLRVLALWLGLPLFYLAWNRLLGRGMAPWYVVGPAAFSAVAAALAFDEVRAACAQWQLRAALSCLLWAAAIACFMPLPFRGLVAWKNQIVQLAGRLPRPRAAPGVRTALTHLQPARVLLVDCFWAYRYSHLRAAHAPATAIWWFGAADSGKVLAAARDVDAVVICKQPTHIDIARQLESTLQTKLFEDHDYVVLAQHSVAGS